MSLKKSRTINGYNITDLNQYHLKMCILCMCKVTITSKIMHGVKKRDDLGAKGCISVF